MFVLRVLRSRLARNILFWYIILDMTVDNNAGEYGYPARYYYIFIAVTTAILLVMTYTNNLWLVPRFLAKRRYWIYFPLAFALSVFAALAYTLTVKTALARFPVMEIQQIAGIHSPVSADWSIAAILEDTESYWGGLVMWLFFFTLAWYGNDYARQARSAREARARQAELELSALKHQLQPHFLFNTLNNLYGLASAQSAKAPAAILQLSELLRYLLYDSAADKVLFSAEVDAMRAYTDLERLRLEDSAVIEVEAAGPGEAELPPLLWLPVLENAFKHGTRFIGGPYEIFFRMEVADGKLSIACRNRYKPEPSNEPRMQGIGLANLRQRLALLFPNRHELSIETRDEWFNLRLTATLQSR